MTLQTLDYGAAWELANHFVGRWNDHDVDRILAVVSQDVSWEDPLFTEVLDGRNGQLANGVQRTRCCEPRDFDDYARGTAAASVRRGSPVAG